METILLANALGRARRVVEGGREYLVAPCTSLVPGVLNGSQGALYYPPEECAANHKAWDRVPITAYHPTQNGDHVSANHDGVLDRQGIGEVRDSIFNGKLRHTLWFDVADTKRVDPRIYQALIAGKPLEVSTGLYTDNEQAPAGANHNGKGYDWVARNHRPDHLAVLPDQVGACSVRDGCGVLVNKNGQARNANPEGCNQYKSCGAAADKASAKATKEGTAESHDAAATAHREAAAAYEKAYRGEGGSGGFKESEFAGREKAIGHLTVGRDKHRAAADDHQAHAEAKRQNVPVETVRKWMRGEVTNTSGEATVADKHSVWRRLGQLLGITYVQATPAANASTHDQAGRFSAGKGALGPEEEEGGEGEDGSSQGGQPAAGKGKDAKDDKDKKPGVDAVEYGGADAQDRYDKYKAQIAGNAAPGQGKHLETGQYLNAGGRPGTKQTHAAAVKGGTHPEGDNGHCPDCGKPSSECSCGETDVQTNANPEGHNQYTGSAGGNADKKVGGKYALVAHRTGGKVDVHLHDSQDSAGLQHGQLRNDSTVKGIGRSGKLPSSMTVGKLHEMTAAQYGKKGVKPEDVTVHNVASQGLAAVFNMDFDALPVDAKHAAFAAMDSGGGAPTREATAASRRAGDKGTAASHRTASAAHREAAEHHADHGNTEMAAAHKAAAKSHYDKARSLSKGTTNMNREQILAALTANCKCDEDRAALNALSDETVTGLWAARVRNAKAEGSNADTSGGGGSAQAGGEEDDDNKNDLEWENRTRVSGKGGKMAGNAVTVNQNRPTANEWLASAPPEIQSAVRNAMEVERQTKVGLVRQLIANVHDDGRRKELGNRFMAKPLDELRELTSLLPPVHNAGDDFRAGHGGSPLYLGAAGGADPLAANSGQDDDRDDILALPTMNFADISAESRGIKAAQ